MKSLLLTLLMQVGERGLQIVAALGITALVARAVGPEGFGLFQYVQSLVFVASAAALVCGAEVVVPRLSRALPQPKQHAIVTHAFLLRMAGAALGYVGLLLAAFLMGPDHGEHPAALSLAAILGLSILLREPFGVVIAWAQAHSQLRPVVRQSLLALALKAVLIGAAFVAGQLSLLVVAVVLATESLLVAILLVRHYRQQTGAQGWPPLERALLRAMARQGLVYFVGLAGLLLFKRIDQLMLKDAVSLAELGVYAAAMQLTDNFTLVATIATATLAPSLVYAPQDERQARGNLLRLTTGLGLAGLVGAMLLWAAATPIVRLVYGSAFGQTVDLLRLAALIAPLVFVEAGLNLALLRDGKAEWVAGKWLLAAAAAALTNPWAIAALGARGALAGVAAGLSCALLVNLAWLLRRKASDVRAA